MDIYITAKDTGMCIALSMMPKNIKRKAPPDMVSRNIINRGEIKTPKNMKLMTVSWSGMLPGRSRRNAAYVKSHLWLRPKFIEMIFEIWKVNGTKLRLLVTETYINHDVYILDFAATNTGGNGDIEYEISFVEARDVFVYTTSELNLRPLAQANASTSSQRPEPAAASVRTYTVVKGDTLWAIAQKYLGRGSRYTEIYELNKDIIGSDADKIYPGQVFTLP